MLGPALKLYTLAMIVLSLFYRCFYKAFLSGGGEGGARLPRCVENTGEISC
jgi:hypothetical protein